MKQTWRTKVQRDIANRDRKEWLSSFSVICLSGGYMNFVCNRCNCRGHIESFNKENNMALFDVKCSDCGNMEKKTFMVS